MSFQVKQESEDWRENYFFAGEVFSHKETRKIPRTPKGAGRAQSPREIEKARFFGEIVLNEEGEEWVIQKPRSA